MVSASTFKYESRIFIANFEQLRVFHRSRELHQKHAGMWTIHCIPFSRCIGQKERQIQDTKTQCLCTFQTV